MRSSHKSLPLTTTTTLLPPPSSSSPSSSMLDPLPVSDPLQSKGKQRDMSGLPTGTDLAERMIAFQRRNAGASRLRDRTERSGAPANTREQPSAAPPAAAAAAGPSRERAAPPTATASSSRAAVSPRKRPAPSTSPKVSLDAHADEFSRKLRISDSTRAGGGSGANPSRTNTDRKLYNPNAADTTAATTLPPSQQQHPNSSLRRSAVEHSSAAAAAASEAAGNGYASRRSPKNAQAAQHRQLFDPRKDDPMRFSRPTASPSSKVSTADHASSASGSSYAPSIASSSWTLNTTTTDDSSMGDTPGKADESTTNAFSAQLKRLYRAITALEAKIINEDAAENNEDVRVVLRGAQDAPVDEEAEIERWRKVVADHKRLAEMMRNLLEISLAPSVPASLRNIPRKYNIITRLWTYGFHKLLESLRRAACNVPRDAVAFEHLQEFIYFAYTFYTHMLEERSLDEYESYWLEALGDLARYRMNVAAMAASIYLPSSGVSAAAFLSNNRPSSGGGGDDDAMSAASFASHAQQARIDDSPVPSVGVAAARLLESEPEKERWRQIAREWYSSGVAATPGAGKLHHHLGLLSREREGEELRGIYHFTKSMIALHPFSTSRESVLPLWSLTAQARRQLPEARATELFVSLHGMLFTNIQLDDFQPTLARFLERLELEGAEEREWTMMAVINIASVLEYGKPTGAIRRAGGVGAREAAPTAPTTRVRLASRKEEDGAMDVDDDARVVTAIQTSPTQTEAAAGLPMAFTYALELTFSMLAYTLRRPTRKASPFARSTLNPYNTVMLTFLATLSKHAPSLALLERAVPWGALAAFLSSVPRTALAQAESTAGGAGMLPTSGQTPLDEDWCVRGAEWVGRRVYERGFWKVPTGAARDARMELEVLDRVERVQGADSDGVIEEDDCDARTPAGPSDTERRWIRLARSGVTIARCVDGLVKVEGSREWRIGGVLKEKVTAWAEEDRLAKEEDERRRTRKRWDDDDDEMDVDGGAEEDESEEDENDTQEVRELKARRRWLRSLVQSGRQQPETTPAPVPSRTQRISGRKSTNVSGPSLKLAAGYTILVMDTNILLSSLSLVQSLVDTLHWTVVVPLPVVMELEGLSKSAGALAEVAAQAMAYVQGALRTHALSLKVQTSRGNYLPNLNVRTERVDLSSEDGPGAWERNMDDLILRAAIWQDEHWVDRSALLKAEGVDTAGAEKIVLLSFDRNLRLKARARKLAAANEQDLATVLAMGT